MKEATGELSMTVIVIIGAIAIVGIVAWLRPKISDFVTSRWNSIAGQEECDDKTWDPVKKQCVDK